MNSSVVLKTYGSYKEAPINKSTISLDIYQDWDRKKVKDIHTNSIKWDDAHMCCINK